MFFLHFFLNYRNILATFALPFFGVVLFFVKMYQKTAEVAQLVEQLTCNQ